MERTVWELNQLLFADYTNFVADSAEKLDKLFPKERNLKKFGICKAIRCRA